MRLRLPFAVSAIVLGALGVFYFCVRRGRLSSGEPDLGIEMKLVMVRGGEFRMGAVSREWGRQADEIPQREVVIADDYYVGICEVTQRQWQAVMGVNPSAFRGGDLPVETVSHGDVVEFCEELSDRSGWSVRLPTEAEWEYACRAGTTTAYSCGAQITEELANFGSDLGPRGSADGGQTGGTRSVGSYAPNHWGIHDMHGNVWEWCADRYAPVPAERRPGSGPPAEPPVVRHVARGGAWLSGKGDCRSASRSGFPADSRAAFIGFRVVVEP